MSDSLQISVTYKGRTEIVECAMYPADRQRARGRKPVFYGVFPTGTKAHPMRPDFVQVLLNAEGRQVLASTGRPVSRHEIIGIDQNGGLWRLDPVLYTHNRNRGRLAGWSDELSPSQVARW